MSPAYDTDRLEHALQTWRHKLIEPTEKGFAALGPVTPAELVERKVSLHDDQVTFPLMVIKESALTSNVATLAAWCGERGVRLAPHGKTTMSPELIGRQLAAGAWGVTAATIGQVRSFVEFGVRRVLLANQLVDPAGIAWLASAANADPALSVICYIDSLEGVGLLDQELSRAGFRGRLPVLVELGVPGRRTGARSATTALEVARAAARTATLGVVGASGYEGVLGHSRTPDMLAAVAQFCRDVRSLARELRSQDLIDVDVVSQVDEEADVLVSAGGSTYFDVVARELADGDGAQANDEGGARVVAILRSGGYVTHDDGLYAVDTPLPTGGSPHELRAALEVWAHVLSRPEPGRALVGAGRRDLPFDAGLPIVRRVVSARGSERPVDGITVTALNDQHAFLDVAAEAVLEPGDRVGFGISHPCTAFDKWRVIPIVDDDYVIVDVVHTLF